MTQQKLTYTKELKGGKLKMTKMEIGSSFAGVVTNIESGQYGPVVKMDINGKEATIYPAGTFKKDILNNNVQVGDDIVVTRQADIPVGKFVSSSFTVTQRGGQTTPVQNVSNVVTDAKEALKARIQAAKNASNT